MEKELLQDIQAKIKTIRKDLLLTSNNYLACEVDRLLRELITDTLKIAAERGYLAKGDVELVARTIWANTEVM